MRDEHLTPVLAACSEAELALLIEFLGRPPSGLLWLDSRVREPGTSHAVKAAAVTGRILRVGDHSIASRLGAGRPSYLQVVCDVLQEFELSEAPGDGILALEMRIVRHCLDSEFDRLPAPVQAALLERFHSGEFFHDGLRGDELVEPLFVATSAETRALAPAKAGRALRALALRKGAAAAWKRARGAALKLVLRGLATPIGWALTAWEYAGPAFRLTVPAICYVAYLRHKQQSARPEVAEAAANTA